MAVTNFRKGRRSSLIWMMSGMLVSSFLPYPSRAESWRSININAVVQQTIRGEVKGSNGEVLSGVTVAVKGKSTVSSTDNTGSFSISASVGDILEFKSVGYETKEVVISTNYVSVVLNYES